MHVLNKLISFWKRFNVCFVIDKNINIPSGAATFSVLTIDAIKNKKNIIFIYPCYRPLDSNGNINIRSCKFIQIQIIICNFQQICQDFNLSPISIAYNSLKEIFGHHLFNALEDNWSSPTMKSFGIGWEYRIMGIEVLQITKLNTFKGINISNDNIYEYAYGYDRINNILFKNQEYKKIINSFDYLNNCFDNFCKKSTNELNNIFDYLLNKKDLLYDEFLLLNLIFNILDSRNIYNIYIKNLYMKVISNKIKELKYEYK
ncbi:glycyl-tRNA synthetase subunit alpha [uncultured bacterium]|nr:glycyl-tRNA synthetase subunit alpha [uncultured bacterium]